MSEPIRAFVPFTGDRPDPVPTGSLVRDGIIRLHGFIERDGPINAEAVRAGLAELAGQSMVEVEIDSDGGSLPEGVRIYTVLRESPVAIRVHIERAGSIASVVALAGSEITIAENASVLVHDPRYQPFGSALDAAQLRAMAAMLEAEKESLLDIYQRRTRQPRADLARLMSAEAEFRGSAAVEAGFADLVVPDRGLHPCPHCGQALPRSAEILSCTEQQMSEPKNRALAEGLSA